MTKRAFTLVELIVVITILSILWTIAFISLQWYSRDSRDSKRIWDIQNIKTALELYSLKTWKYPAPDNFKTVSYSWATEIVRYQWIVWDQVTRNLKTLVVKPLDPLTNTPYIYSVTNIYKEYEVLALYEWNVNITYNTFINKANAATTTLTPKIEWTYNWVFVKTPNYIIPTPSIITSETLSWILILNPINIKSQVVSGWNNIPQNTLIQTSTWKLNMNLSVYSWSITKNSTYIEKINAMQQIQKTYTWTQLWTSNSTYSYILNQQTDKQKVILANTILKLTWPSKYGKIVNNNWTLQLSTCIFDTSKIDNCFFN